MNNICARHVFGMKTSSSRSVVICEKCTSLIADTVSWLICLSVCLSVTSITYSNSRE